jgi:hypothetical protein
MAGEACINDTDTVDLSFNGSSELEADVRLRTITDGSLTANASGLGLAVASDGGIIASASGAKMKVTTQGLHVGAEGLMKVNGYGVTTSPGSSPNANILRGVNTQYGNTLQLNGSFPSNELGSYLYCHARWRGIWVTNLTAFGGQLQDRVDAYLQINTDSAGWGTVDQAALTRANCGGSFHLDYWHNIFIANGTVHTIQARLLVGGGVVTGNAVQGLLENEYGGVLEYFY